MFTDTHKISALSKITQIKRLKSCIPHSNWFISGSFANPNVLKPNDIDVYFYSIDDLNLAVIAMAGNPKWEFCAQSHLSYTYFPLGGKAGDLSVQLVCKHYGSPEKIFTNFDLNLCKRAITAKGDVIVSPDLNVDPYRIQAPSASSYDRLIKYLTRNVPPVNSFKVLKDTVDEFICNSTLIENYYGDITDWVPKTVCNNQILFSTFYKVKIIKSYLLEQTKLHAPELLI